MSWYRKVITDFVDGCERNHLHLNASKTKEMITDFHKKASHTTPVNTLSWAGTELVWSHQPRYPNNKLIWSDHTQTVYKKGQSQFHLLGIFWSEQTAANDL